MNYVMHPNIFRKLLKESCYAKINVLSKLRIFWKESFLTFTDMVASLINLLFSLISFTAKSVNASKSSFSEAAIKASVFSSRIGAFETAPATNLACLVSGWKEPAK